MIAYAPQQSSWPYLRIYTRQTTTTATLDWQFPVTTIAYSNYGPPIEPERPVAETEAERRFRWSHEAIAELAAIERMWPRVVVELPRAIGAFVRRVCALASSWRVRR